VINHTWEQKFVYCSVDTLCALRMESEGQASQYLIQEFDATNYNERNNNQTELDITAILHDLTVFMVAALNNAPG